MREGKLKALDPPPFLALLPPPFRMQRKLSRSRLLLRVPHGPCFPTMKTFDSSPCGKPRSSESFLPRPLTLPKTFLLLLLASFVLGTFMRCFSIGLPPLLSPCSSSSLQLRSYPVLSPAYTTHLYFSLKSFIPFSSKMLSKEETGRSPLSSPVSPPFCPFPLPHTSPAANQFLYLPKLKRNQRIKLERW